MFKRILVPLDGSSLAECVLPHVIALSKPYNASVTVLQVHKRPKIVTGQLQPVAPFNWHVSRMEAQKYLESVTAKLIAAGVRANHGLIDGLASDSIIKYAQENEIDLLILSSHGDNGLSGWNISSVALKVVARALVPTMIIRAYEPIKQEISTEGYRKVLIPLDTSPRAECALTVATSIVRYYQARLLLSHVVRRPKILSRSPLTPEDIELIEKLTNRNHEEAKKYLDYLLFQLNAEGIDTQKRLVIADKPAVALCNLVIAENPELVIINAHGYTGETKWPYGNIVEKFINYCHIPLIIYQDFSPKEIELTKAEILSKETTGH
jgi:nucleotide-binding universal stress UspA family protein